MAAGIILPAALALLAGCASQTTPKPAVAEKAPAAPVTTAPAPARDVDTNVLAAAAKPSAAWEGTGWKSLFDGQTLKGWQVTDFAGHGAVDCEAGLMVIEAGDALSGVNWTNEVPKMNYEVALDAMKLKGGDFFCGLTFPVGDAYCSLFVGGWGGTVVGLSSVDEEDASENETTQFIRFEPDRWYRVRVRVTEKKIEAWIDETKQVDLKTKDRKIGLRFGEIELSVPLGLATYQTTAAVREIKIRRLEGGEGAKN